MEKQTNAASSVEEFVKLLREYKKSEHFGNSKVFIEKCAMNEGLKISADDISHLKIIDDIYDEDRAIQEDKASGMSREQSLLSRIKELTSTEDVEPLEAEIIEQTNKAIVNESKSSQIPAPVVALTDAPDTIGERLKRSTVESIDYFALSAEEQDQTTINLSEEDRKHLEEYFNREIDDPNDRDFKKILTATLISEKNKGNPKFKDMSATELAIMSDRAAEYSKMSYKVAQGKMEAPSMVDRLIDRAASYVTVILKNGLPKAGGRIGEVVGASLGTIFGPKGMYIGAQIGKSIGQAAGKSVASLFSQGVKKVAEYAKSFSTTIITGVSKTYEFVKNLFS